MQRTIFLLLKFRFPNALSRPHLTGKARFQRAFLRPPSKGAAGPCLASAPVSNAGGGDSTRLILFPRLDGGGRHHCLLPPPILFLGMGFTVSESQNCQQKENQCFFPTDAFPWKGGYEKVNLGRAEIYSDMWQTIK